ncbi:TKL/DRK protein kinase, variant 1 [Balamuthia mandrillaris]
MGVCNTITSAKWELGDSYCIPIFQLCIVAVTFISICYLLFRLRPSASSSSTKVMRMVGLYWNFIIVTCLTYLFVVLIYVLPKPPNIRSSPYGIAYTIASQLTLIAQWLIQVAVVFFLFEKTTDKHAVRWTAGRSLGVALILAVISITTTFYGSEPRHRISMYGFLAIQAILVVFFAVSLLFGMINREPIDVHSHNRQQQPKKLSSSSSPSSPTSSSATSSPLSLSSSHSTIQQDRTEEEEDDATSEDAIEGEDHPLLSNRTTSTAATPTSSKRSRFKSRDMLPRCRPAGRVWSFFQMVAHMLYAVYGIIYLFGDSTELTACSDVISKSLYYLLYAPLLYYTVAQDAAYWRKRGAYILAAQNVDPEHGFDYSLSLSKADNDPKAGGLPAVTLRIIPSTALTFESLIGMGAMGEVYKAMWQGTIVAVKKFKVGRVEMPAVKKDLLQESQLLGELRHPNIILLLGVCVEDDNLCIVTEYMKRGSLFDLLYRERREKQRDGEGTKEGEQEAEDGKGQKGEMERQSQLFLCNPPFSPELLLKILRDVARGMTFLHGFEPPIVHRDLKSQNLLIDENWNTKVADFGMSRVRAVTSTMTRVGTPQWMAPEMLREQRYTEKADVYSFGVVLWELLTGEPPFRGVNPFRVIYMVAHEKVMLPTPTNCPPALATLLQQCLNQNPKQRPSFHEILQQLEALRPSDVECRSDSNQ